MSGSALFLRRSVSAAAAAKAVDNWTTRTAQPLLASAFAKWHSSGVLAEFDSDQDFVALLAQLSQTQVNGPFATDVEFESLIKEWPDLVAGLSRATTKNSAEDPANFAWVKDAAAALPSAATQGRSELMDLLRPVSSIATGIYVVDPYFLSDRNKEAREAFIDWLSDQDSFGTLGLVSILAGARQDGQDPPLETATAAARDFEATLLQRLPKGARVEVRVVKRELFHDRLVSFVVKHPSELDPADPAAVFIHFPIQVGFGIAAWLVGTTPTVVSRVPPATCCEIWQVIRGRGELRIDMAAR
jgi:hypothetical protein